MPNNFEKQVKEKMDELQFVPTAPVWEHIEKQIRTKKDRRRLFLWLPIFILLTGAGTWLLRNGESNQGNRGTVMVQNHKLNDITPVPTNSQESSHIMDQRPGSTRSSGTRAIGMHFQKLAGKNTSRNNFSPGTGLVLNIGEKNIIKEKSQPQQLDSLLKAGEPGIELNERENDYRPPVPNIVERLLTKPGFTLLIDSIKARQVTTGTEILIDSPLVQVNNVKKHHWQIGITASAGFSGLSKNFDVIPASLQADYGSVSGNINYNGYNSSPVTKNHAYAIGARAKKSLSSRISFTLGFDYLYYSTLVKVGQKLQDTLIGLNNSVSRSYMGYGPYLQDYSNRYHFLSLPVSLVWRTGAHMPLYFESSFSLQQMIHTNGLIFNAGTGNYYTDQSAYNKTQFMAGLGLSYELMPSSLFIGPQAQFGLRNMEKNGSSNHLVYTGLQVRYFFKNIK